MPTERIDYAHINDPAGTRRTRESFVDTDDIPSNNGAGHAYFIDSRLGTEHPVETDIGTGSKFVKDGELMKMVSGHVLLYCPKCAAESGRMSPLHAYADQKTIYIKEAAQLYRPKSNPRRHFFLSLLTILEPVACNYREKDLGACTWRARIANGVAVEIGGAGLRFFSKGTGLVSESGSSLNAEPEKASNGVVAS